jgi:nucleoside-diphosphate-sugar epimerase
MENALVIGGNGLLGYALVRALKNRGVRTVRSFDMTGSPDPQVDSFIGDLRNSEQVAQACEGADTVFQTAALVDWGPRSRERLLAVNVQGNRNVITACQNSGVKRLVYTSSIDVVFNGQPIRNGDETLPYPKTYLDDYGYTKAIAEQDTLTANTENGLQTCSLRSAGIYGPSDRNRFPHILKAARAGKMMYMGDGSARFNHVYVTNLVEAHIRAAQALAPGSPLSGQAYFITDHPATNFYNFFTPYLSALGYPIPVRRLPTWLTYALAVVMENASRLGLGPATPLLTRYVVLSTCRDFYFNHQRATRDFGYQPVVSAQEAFEETLHWLKEQV